MVRDSFHLTIPEAADPDLYDIVVGWYPSTGCVDCPPGAADEATATGQIEPSTGKERLRVNGADAYRVAVVPVGWDAAGQGGLTPLDEEFGDAITLEGYGFRFEPGVLDVTLRWSAAEYLDVDYAVFVHLVTPETDGAILAQGDSMPLDGRWPTSLWLPGVAVDDTHAVAIPQGVREGAHWLLVGLYDPVTGDRLPLAGDGDALPLGEVVLP
jgi:hypothetical protein